MYTDACLNEWERADAIHRNDIDSVRRVFAARKHHMQGARHVVGEAIERLRMKATHSDEGVSSEHFLTKFMVRRS
jgi:hypothetical protein